MPAKKPRYRCPLCGGVNQLDVTVRCWARLDQRDPDNLQTDVDTSDQEWNDDSSMRCGACGCNRTGKVSEFIVRPGAAPVAIHCVIACKNAGGAPDFVGVRVACTEAQQEDGQHYAAAMAWAEEHGYEEPMVVYDEDDGPPWLFAQLAVAGAIQLPPTGIGEYRVDRRATPV
jgi:hypothetical protein